MNAEHRHLHQTDAHQTDQLAALPVAEVGEDQARLNSSQEIMALLAKVLATESAMDALPGRTNFSRHRLAAHFLGFGLLCAILTGAASGQSTSEMKQAKQAEFEKVESQLDKLYQAFLKTQDQEGAAKLAAAQKAWLQFRDAEAAFAAHSERGGSAAAVIQLQSQIEQTKLRIQQLKSY